MTLNDWLFVIRAVYVLVFLICLVGNVRAMGYIGRIARKPNRPISKSTMFGLNILFLGALFGLVASFRGRAPVDGYNVALSLGRNFFWGAMAVKTIVTEELIIHRPEKLFTVTEQQKIAEEVGITRNQVNRVLRKFLE